MSNSRRRETDPKCHLVHTHFCAVVLDTVNSISPFLPFLPNNSPSPARQHHTKYCFDFISFEKGYFLYLYNNLISLISLLVNFRHFIKNIHKAYYLDYG